MGCEGGFVYCGINKIRHMKRYLICLPLILIASVVVKIVVTSFALKLILALALSLIAAVVIFKDLD
jgi:hypothetical protein